MPINLTKLAAIVAKKDPSDKRNEDVVSTLTAFANLGEYLRQSSPEHALEVLAAIVTRGGKQKRKSK